MDNNGDCICPANMNCDGCPDGQWMDENGNCHCKEPFMMDDNGDCYCPAGSNCHDCPAGFYYDFNEGHCVCVPGSTGCGSCPEDQHLENGRCVCTNAPYFDVAQQKCVTYEDIIATAPATTTTTTAITFPTIDPTKCEDLSIYWKGTKWSKIIYRAPDSIMLRVNVANNDLANVDLNNDKYLGFLLYTKKMCGPSFVKGWHDGSLSYRIFDFYSKYQIKSTFVRLDKSQTLSTVQFSADDSPDNSDLGDNTKKDQFFLEISGLDEIDFGTKDMEACIQSVQVGVLRGEIDWAEDYTGCVANKYYVV